MRTRLHFAISLVILFAVVSHIDRVFGRQRGSDEGCHQECGGERSSKRFHKLTLQQILGKVEEINAIFCPGALGIQ